MKGRVFTLLVLLHCFTDIVIAAPEECNFLTFTISGAVSEVEEIKLDPNPSIKLDNFLTIPLDLIGGDDALLMVTVRRTAERIWVVDSVNTSKDDRRPEEQLFAASSHLYFDEEGNQERISFVDFHPVTTSERASLSLVRIRFKDLHISKEPTKLSITTNESTKLECQNIGGSQIDFANEVNNGEEIKLVTYESAEDALSAMLDAR